MSGWIKISREIVNHWLWRDAERLRWWLDLLFLAAWDDKQQLVGRQLITLQRGQLIASLSYLCKRWGRSRTMVESFLNLLEKEDMIRKEMSHNIAVITVVNYEKYQEINQLKNDAHLEVYPDAHLESGIRQRKSTTCKQEKPKESTYLDAHLEAYPDAHLDATNKEYKNIYNKASINRCSSETSSEAPKIDIDIKRFILFFNSEMDKAGASIPRARSISGQRLSMLNARCREYGKEAVCDAIRKAAQSNFLNGGGSRGFVADFTWIFRPNNFPRVLEGFYDNNQNQQSNGNNKQGDQTKRRGFEVEASSSEDYKTSF